MKYIYTGLRLDGDKVLQCFVDEKGREAFWRGIKYVILGGVYVGNKKKGTLSRTPELVAQVEVKPQWEDKDTSAHQFLLKRREVARANNLARRYWDRTLSDIHSRSIQLTFFERREFAQAIARIILKGKP